VVELLVILVLAMVYLGVPALIAVAVYHFYDGKYAYEARIATLERQIDQLERDRSE